MPPLWIYCYLWENVIFKIKAGKEETLRISTICFVMIKMIISDLVQNCFKSVNLYEVEVKNMKTL